MLVNIDPEIVPKAKLGAHSLQIIFGFVAWCLEIAVWRDDDSKIVGNNGWPFGVFLLSIPAWIFLICTPRFDRTRRFAQPQAMLAVDGIFTIFWLSAFASQAAYNSSGLCGGACGVSKGVVALAVFATFAWCGSTFLGLFTVNYYQFHGTLPGYDRQKLGGSSNNDPDKAAFSMAPHDEEAYAPINMDDHEPTGGRSDYDAHDPYGPPSSYGGGSAVGRYHEEDDPSRYGSLPSRQNNLYDADTEYHSAHQQPPPTASTYVPPTAHNEFEDDRPAQFPTADYERTTR